MLAAHLLRQPYFVRSTTKTIATYLQKQFHYAPHIPLFSRGWLHKPLVLWLIRRILYGAIPLISFGGNTTPGGALISAIPPIAVSPSIAEGAMIERIDRLNYGSVGDVWMLLKYHQYH
jgi:hypothetical protein